jgi:maleamate amidohydrolase
MTADEPDSIDIYERAGMDTLTGYGDSPALVVVDLQRGFTDPDCALGGDLTSVVERTNELLRAAHNFECPVVATRIVTSHPSGADLGVWIEKIPTLKMLAAGSEWIDLDERLDLADDDHVLDKRQASAFHETELHSMLTAWGVDTLVVAGCTTSGCVRATAVDGCAHGFRVVVPEQGVGDRASEPHEANLFDIHAKYGDVRSVEEVLEYFSNSQANSSKA